VALRRPIQNSTLLPPLILIVSHPQPIYLDQTRTDCAAIEPPGLAALEPKLSAFKVSKGRGQVPSKSPETSPKIENETGNKRTKNHFKTVVYVKGLLFTPRGSGPVKMIYCLKRFW